MNRTIPAPKPAGIFWPVMLGHMVPGELHPIRLLKTVNYPDGSSTLEHRKYVTDKQASYLVGEGKRKRMMDMHEPNKNMHPIMSQLMHALGQKQPKQPVGFHRLQEDLSWRGATQNQIQQPQPQPQQQAPNIQPAAPQQGLPENPPDFGP